MAAYVVFCLKSVHDEEALSRYRAAAMELLPKQNVDFFAGPAVIEMLEGEPLQSGVILAFDTVEKAREWYYSPEYQALANIRKPASETMAFIVETPSFG